MSKLEEHNQGVISYTYEIIDLEKDENHNVIYRIVGQERRHLSIRSSVQRKTNVTEGSS